MEEEVVLCAASAYEQKFYLNPQFESLPEAVRQELQIMCVLYTEDVGGILLVVYDEEGNLTEELEDKLSVRGCKKAKDFVDFCDAFGIPVLTLTNVTGFNATKCSERNIAREAAKLTYAFANATVPKVNVIVGKAYGSAYIVMNSKSIGADMVYAWPQAEIGMMDANLAAKIMYEGADASTLNEKAAEYKELQNGIASAAARGYVDAVIDPENTRQYVAAAFEMLFSKREVRPDKKHGTV